MSTPLIVIVTLIYVGVGVDQYLKGSLGMCITFMSYAAANVGLIMAMES